MAHAPIIHRSKKKTHFFYRRMCLCAFFLSISLSLSLCLPFVIASTRQRCRFHPVFVCFFFVLSFSNTGVTDENVNLNSSDRRNVDTYHIQHMDLYLLTHICWINIFIQLEKCKRCAAKIPWKNHFDIMTFLTFYKSPWFWMQSIAFSAVFCCASSFFYS